MTEPVHTRVVSAALAVMAGTVTDVCDVVKPSATSLTEIERRIKRTARLAAKFSGLMFWPCKRWWRSAPLPENPVTNPVVVPPSREPAQTSAVGVRLKFPDSDRRRAFTKCLSQVARTKRRWEPCNLQFVSHQNCIPNLMEIPVSGVHNACAIIDVAQIGAKRGCRKTPEVPQGEILCEVKQRGNNSGGIPNRVAVGVRSVTAKALNGPRWTDIDSSSRGSPTERKGMSQPLVFDVGLRAIRYLIRTTHAAKLPWAGNSKSELPAFKFAHPQNKVFK